MLRWLILFIIVGSIFFATADFYTAYEYSEYRNEYNKTSDHINDCIQLTNTKDFLGKLKYCQSFLKQNKKCETFPEKNKDCPEFLSKPYYIDDKNFCRSWSTKVKQCKEVIHDNLGYSSLIDLVESPFIINLSEMIGYPLNTLLGNISFNGIKISDPWYKQVNQFTNETQYVYIATLAPAKTELDFFQGVELAGEQINKTDGVLGRKIKFLRYIDDNGTLDWNRNTVNQIIKDKRIIALINRQNSETTKPLTMTFEAGGLLTLTISAANVNVILANMRYNFRTHPNNDVLSKESAKYFAKNGHLKVAMITGLDEYSREVGRAFYSASLNLGIRIVYIKAFHEGQSDFTNIVNDLKKKGANAIFLSGTREASSSFVYQARRFGINIPIYGSKTLENQDFINKTGDAAEGIIVPSIYNETLEHEENKKFVAAYREKYGKIPSTWAAQGYDAVNLIANSIKYAHSTEPLKIASIIRYHEKWVGAGGSFRFSESGEIIDRKIYFKKIENGEFVNIN